MRVLQIVRPGEAEWTEAPVPQPGLGEVLVKVLGVTTCPHWDIHLMDGEPMFPGAELEYPLTPGQPGHEMVGDVIEIGPGVESPVVGDRVAAWRDRGTKVSQGCYAQYVAFDADCLLVVPRDLEVDAIASLELAMCVHVTFDQLAKFGGVRGKRVGVAGLGPAGLPLGLQLITPPFDEETLFRAAAALERAAGFTAAPPFDAGAENQASP